MMEDNDIALEESTVFELRITASSPSFVLGGQVSMGMLFKRTSVTIQDNDGEWCQCVYVGGGGGLGDCTSVCEFLIHF